MLQVILNGSLQVVHSCVWTLKCSRQINDKMGNSPAILVPWDNDYNCLIIEIDCWGGGMADSINNKHNEIELLTKYVWK